MTIDIEAFYEKYHCQEYRHGTFIPEDVLDYLDILYLRGEKVAEVRDTLFEEIEDNKRELEEIEAKIKIISRHSAAGYELEKTDIMRAIEEYKKCIRIGETTHALMYYLGAYDRIIILLHKVKDYEGEQQYIRALLKHNISDSQRMKYENRLTKLIKKNEQTQGI